MPEPVEIAIPIGEPDANSHDPSIIGGGPEMRQGGLMVIKPFAHRVKNIREIGYADLNFEGRHKEAPLAY